jgi:hypothetical protein
MKSAKTNTAQALAVIEEELFVTEDDFETLKGSPIDAGRGLLKPLEWRGIPTEPRQMELFEIVR